MANTPRITEAVANAALTAAFGGTICQSAIIRIYNGTQPVAGGGSDAGSTALAELTMDAATPWGAGASGGVLTAGAIADETDALATLAAQWFRLETAGATPLIDGSVGTTGCDMNLNSTAITEHGTVSITAFTITQPLL